MRPSLAAAIAALVILALALVWHRNPQTGERANADAAAKSSALPASSVLRINPGAPASPLSHSSPEAASVPPEIMQLRSRAGWAPLREGVASATPTPAALYV